MADRICSLCDVSYTDEEGAPHPYAACIEKLDEEIDHLHWQLNTLSNRRRSAQRGIIRERSQRQ